MLAAVGSKHRLTPKILLWSITTRLPYIGLIFDSIEAISQELVRFDTQIMRNPDIQGKEYQQGAL
ncbi:MAG: RRXRR domain-containing protein, partial [Nostoc sp.]|uniref:RRXRR domain-containing protein n=1 Tax=Nostoc sp. TaxID=1180 RepID=UPI002FF011FF